MEVDQSEQPYSCGACGNTVIDTRIIQARWYKYTDPAGWWEYGQICGPCLNEQWRSMGHSWDADIHDKSHYTHTQWKTGLFMKVIRRRLRSPPTAGIEEPVRDPEHYELKHPVDPDELEDLPSRLG